ncbi:PAB1 binding protein, variant 2 [Basidiobolus ranarum]
MSLRSLVFAKEAGVIIGRGGQSVKEIRERSGTKVTISEQIQGVNERILTITGLVDTTAKAYSLVAQRLTEDVEEDTTKTLKGATIRLLIPHKRMGYLIGKSGSKIKEIQEASGAKLNASEEMLPHSTERILTINGVADAIQIAIYHVCQILQDHMDRSSDCIPYKPQLRMAYMGGPAPPQFYGAPPAYPPLGIPPMRHDRSVPVHHGAHGSPSHETQSQQIFIPNDMVGCIIGKGGSKINEIRQMSGSHIKIGEPQNDSNERLVTITGPPECNQMALYLLYTRLESEKVRGSNW